MTFTEYCAKEGIELLRDDIKFIRQQLKRIPKTHHKPVMKRYVEIWVNTRDGCKGQLRSSNEARKAANLYLLEFHI